MAAKKPKKPVAKKRARKPTTDQLAEAWIREHAGRIEAEMRQRRLDEMYMAQLIRRADHAERHPGCITWN